MQAVRDQEAYNSDTGYKPFTKALATLVAKSTRSYIKAMESATLLVCRDKDGEAVGVIGIKIKDGIYGEIQLLGGNKDYRTVSTALIKAAKEEMKSRGIKFLTMRIAAGAIKEATSSDLNNGRIHSMTSVFEIN